MALAVSPVAAVHAAIEIVDSRIADWKIPCSDTVIDNGLSAFFVLAGEGTPLEGMVKMPESAKIDITVLFGIDRLWRLSQPS